MDEWPLVLLLTFLHVSYLPLLAVGRLPLMELSLLSHLTSPAHHILGSHRGQEGEA